MPSITTLRMVVDVVGGRGMWYVTWGIYGMQCGRYMMLFGLCGVMWYVEMLYVG